jgi:hypothetical protein
MKWTVADVMRAVRLVLPVTGAFAAAMTSAVKGSAQEAGARCFLLCAPTLNIEPTFTIENLFSRHRVQDVASGAIARARRETVFEVIVALDIPTSIPRTGLTFEAIWKPFAGSASNPFTGASAGDLGRSQIRDNAVELEFELNLDVLDPAWTDGWLGAHFDIVDKYSPAEQPRAASAYTHKLNLEFDIAVAPFHRLSNEWLRGIEFETSWDYMASGLPRAGDVVPIGEERYLDQASPWSLSFVLVVPVAPLKR